jgi:arsenical pump membrane protein
MTLLYLIVALSIALMLIRPWDIPEAYWVAGGAVLLVLFRRVPLLLAGHALAQGLDVYLFLIGMMLMSELWREHGLFDWVSGHAVNRSQGSALRLFTWVYLLGVAVTVFMSNDATAVVLTPAILPALRKAKVDPFPCLFACVFIANAASFVLPISNPANLVVFNEGLPPLGQWLRWLAVPSVISIVSTYAILWFIFRRALRSRSAEAVAPVPLCGPARIVLIGLAAMVAVLMGASAFKQDLGAPTFGCALVVAGLVSLRNRTNPLRLLREISWSTLALVGGLFVLVNAVERAGALRVTADWLRQAQALPPGRGAAVLGLAVGVANNAVNNLPLGLLASGTLGAVHPGSFLTNVVLLGIDLGPNLSITGSLATVLWLITLRREKIEVGFVRFLKVGAVVMPLTLLLTVGALVLERAWFGSGGF